MAPNTRLVSALVLAFVALMALGTFATVVVETRSDPRPIVAVKTPQRFALIDLAANRSAHESRAPTEFAAWERVAADLRIPVRRLEVEALAEVDLGAFRVWLLADQEQLSEDDWDVLDTFLVSGGGVIATGRTGARDGDGESQALNPLAHLFPTEQFTALEDALAPVEVARRGPLVAGLDPGLRLALATRVSTRRAVAMTRGAACWYDSGRAALIHGQHHGAPVAWLGFGLDALVDRRSADRIGQNVLRYAMRQPIAEIAAWPHGRATAALLFDDAAVSVTIEANPERVDRLAPLRRGDEAGVRLPATPLDIRGARDATAELGVLLNAYELVEERGGLYAVLPDAFERYPELRGVLTTELEAMGVWFVDPDVLAQWWLARETISIEVAPPRTGAIEVALANTGEDNVRGLTARVYLPTGALIPEADLGGWPGSRPTLRVGSDRSWVEFVTPRLKPGARSVYRLRF